MHLSNKIRFVPFALILLTSHCLAEEFENSVFRADFEAKPKVIITALGTGVTVTNVAQDARILRMVQYEGSEFNLVEALDEQTRAKLIRVKVDVLNKLFGAENTSVKTITVDGYEAREIECQAAKIGALYARVILAEHQVFQITLLFKPGQKADPSKAKSFFDSFAIVKESESKPDKFKTIEDKAKRFSGLALPNVRGFRHTVKGSDEKIEWYVSRKGKHLFGIFVHEFPGLAGDDTIDFTAARNTARIAGSKLRAKFKEVSVRNDKEAWRDQAYQSADGKYEMAMKITKVREHVFIVMACGPAASSGSDEQKEYLSKFKVLAK